MLIRSSIGLLAAALIGTAALAQPAAAQSGAPSGRLSCNIGPGLAPIVSGQRPVNCRYSPRRGPVQRYGGVVRGFAIDLGAIKATALSWRVYGPYARAPLGALEGRYNAGGRGISGPGLSGGPDGEVVLLPLSLQGARGVNAAVGVTGFELKLRNSRRR